MSTEGTLESGDIHLASPGLAAIRPFGRLTNQARALPFKGWLEQSGWDVRRSFSASGRHLFDGRARPPSPCRMGQSASIQQASLLETARVSRVCDDVAGQIASYHFNRIDGSRPYTDGTCRPIRITNCRVQLLQIGASRRKRSLTGAGNFWLYGHARYAAIAVTESPFSGTPFQVVGGAGAVLFKPVFRTVLAGLPLLVPLPAAHAGEDVIFIRITSPVPLRASPSDDAAATSSTLPAGSGAIATGEEAGDWIHVCAHMGGKQQCGYVEKSRSTWQPKR